MLLVYHTRPHELSIKGASGNEQFPRVESRPWTTTIAEKRCLLLCDPPERPLCFDIVIIPAHVDIYDVTRSTGRGDRARQKKDPSLRAGSDGPNKEKALQLRGQAAKQDKAKWSHQYSKEKRKLSNKKNK
jgi:hypothetical protein